jgi:hypothetical protein
MYLASAVDCSLPQCRQIKRVVLRLKEHRLPVDPARDDMLWNIGDKVSRLAGHSPSVTGDTSQGRYSKMRFDPIFFKIEYRFDVRRISCFVFNQSMS